MSDSLRPHGLQPTRLLSPWNFPGQSTGLGCHFLLQGIFPTQGSNPGLPHSRQMLYHLSHQGSPYFFEPLFGAVGKNTWVDCHSLLQEIFPTQGLNPGLPHCRQMLYRLKVKVKVKSLSRVWLFGTPWTASHQAPPSMGFYRQEYWSGLPFPSPGILPDPGIEPRSPALQASSLTSEPPGNPLS